MKAFYSGLLLLVVTFASMIGNAAAINICLDRARKLTLAIDQKQTTEHCFRTYAKNLSKSKCFELVNSLKKPDLQENLNSICFYQSQDFSDIKTCASGANQLKLADNHDEALFECYMQFQSQTSQKQCFEISRKLVLPHRKNHMRQHCQNNY